MKIDTIRCQELTGIMPFEGEFWEERLSRPIDIYPEHRAEGVHWLSRRDETKYDIRQVFVEIGTGCPFTSARASR